MLKKILFIIGISSISLTAFAQENTVWSLERCINYAQTQNLTIQQSALSVQQAELALSNNKREYYPNVNGSVTYGFNVGRSVDPTTNDFVNRAIHTNGLSVSAGALVYSGGRVPSSIKQSEFNIQAAQMDMSQAKNNIGLQIANAYLQVLLAEEQLINTQVNIKQLNDQLAQTNKLINAGSLPANNRLDIEAQIATSEQTAVANQNSVDITYLNLKLLLQLEPDALFTIQKPKIELPSVNELDVLSVTTLYKIAEQNQPNIAAGELRKQSAEQGVKIAESALMPTLSIGGSLGTNYSSIGIDQTNPDITPTGADTINTQVIFNGAATTIGIVNPTFDVNFPKASYFNQFGTNSRAYLGLTANIPIYNKGQTKIAIEQAKLNVINSEYNNRILRQTLKSDIQRAIADAKAAAKQLEAAQKSILAQEAAFQNTEKRFQLGAANGFEYNTARNNLESAKNRFILAKYDYIFKLKIIDFYQGKSISL